MFANARQRARSSAVILRGIRGKRGGNHVFAETPVAECRTGAFAADLLSIRGDHRAVILRAGDQSDHALRLEQQDFDAVVVEIFLAAFERLAPRLLAYGTEIKRGHRSSLKFLSWGNHSPWPARLPRR